MLLRGVPRDHSHDDVVTFCESHILVGEVVVGLGERRGDYVPGAATEGLPRSLLKFSGGSVHDYATISDESPSPS